MKKYKVNDIVTLRVSGKKALIVATKSEPYTSPVCRQDYYPEEGYDYIILHESKEGNFEGRDSICKHDIFVTAEL